MGNNAATLTGGLWDQRPVSMQEIADAHDTCTFVLIPALEMRLDAWVRPVVRLTGMRPHPYVPCTAESGWAHWTRPDWRIYLYLPYRVENRFTFEITASFKHFELRAPGSSITPRRPEPPREMTDAEAAGRLHKIASAAQCAGATGIRIDFARRVVTGEYLYLPDHPVVGWVRTFGTMPYEINGEHVPAKGTPYPHRKPLPRVPEGHPQRLAYKLSWDGGPTFALTDADARDLVARFQGKGTVSGALEDHTFTFTDDFGRRATITRYTGEQPILRDTA